MSKLTTSTNNSAATTGQSLEGDHRCHQPHRPLQTKTWSQYWIRLCIAVLCACMITLPLFLIYGRKMRIFRNEPVPPSRFIPTSAAQSSSYLSFHIKVLSIDLIQGQSDLLIHNIRPYGQLASSNGSIILAHDTYLFFNGIALRLLANVPPSNQQVTIQHMNGNINHYPFDKHTVPLGFYAMASHDLNNAVNAVISNSTLNRSPFIPLDWSLSTQSFSYSIRIEQMGNSQLFNHGINDIQLVYQHHVSHKWYAMVVMVIMWAMSTIVLANTISMVVYRHEPHPLWIATNVFLLISLLKLRSTMPGVPNFGTLADTLGFYWNVTFTVLSMLALTIYTYLKHRTEDRQRRARQARAVIVDKLASRRQNQDNDANLNNNQAIIEDGIQVSKQAQPLSSSIVIVPPMNSSQHDQLSPAGTGLYRSESLMYPHDDNINDKVNGVSRVVDPRLVPLPVSHVAPEDQVTTKQTQRPPPIYTTQSISMKTQDSHPT